jgi:Zn-dependent M28 family amino/carboxypeptidase
VLEFINAPANALSTRSTTSLLASERAVRRCGTSACSAMRLAGHLVAEPSDRGAVGADEGDAGLHRPANEACSAKNPQPTHTASASAPVPRSCVPCPVAQPAVPRLDNSDDDRSGATLGEQTNVTIPVVMVSKADGARLRARPAPATIKLNAGVRIEKTRNVLAQTKTGSIQNAVMVGGHLDSVPAGPGINDNGSGVAAVLETALQMGSSPAVHNAVRFAFWGAEEIGLLGSANYVQSLNVDELKDIALYLNVDMLASPNPAYFTYDGNQSAPPDPERGPPPVPEGSAGIERTLVTYLKSAGKTAQDITFEGRSDQDGFTRAGIPIGGIFSGAESKMTAEQARLWGGTADQPYDPNYHQKTDTP